MSQHIMDDAYCGGRRNENMSTLTNHGAIKFCCPIFSFVCSVPKSIIACCDTTTPYKEAGWDILPFRSDPSDLQQISHVLDFLFLDGFIL